MQPAILVHGHRGARALRPENTLPAFEYAISVGADYLEMDVVVTLDDVVVVSHDAQLNRRICTSPGGSRTIRELTFAELGSWDCGTRRHPLYRRQVPAPGAGIPSLDQVLGLARRGCFGFNIEVKSYPDHPELTPPPTRFAELVLHTIRRHNLEDRVMVQSFDFRVLQALARLAPELRLAALYAGKPKSFGVIAREAGTRVVAPHHRLVTRRNVHSAHASGLEVIPWTANTRWAWKRLIAAHVDGIITDDPEGLIRYLAKHSLR
ncbi:MAG: glycerophosphodiester phosphodiesterase family protein [Bryobacteraceae bacterium]